MIEFRTLYDDMEEYVLRRDPESYNAQRIRLEIEYFKIPSLLEVLPNNFIYNSVAEIGCATGEIISTFPGPDIKRRVGFDISPLNIQAAKQRFPEVIFEKGDFQSSIEVFDVVILSDILEHVTNDVEFLRDAAKIGRILLVNLPLEKCLMYSLRKYGPEDPSGHLRNYSLASGLKLLEEAGLSTIHYRQKWSFESEYELFRQELNKSMLGTRFSGTLLHQIIKALIFQFCLHFKWLGRKFFASNLFVAARMRG